MKTGKQFRGFAVGLAAIGLLGGSQVARANFWNSAPLANAIENYAVLYEGAGGHNLQINSSVNANNGTGYAVDGSVGVGTELGGNPTVMFNNPGSINGNINFAGTDATRYQPAGGSLNGSVNFGVSQVNTDLNALNTLSQTLAGEAATTLSISGTTTVNANGGTLDGNGNYVYNLSSFSLNNGQTLTINGTANQFVVFNINFNVHFSGQIVETGGIGQDQVLFNITGGNDATLSGGDTVQEAANHADQYATFLDPNGNFNMNSVTVQGHMFGGDSADMQIVSGSNIIVPEPAPMALLAMSLGLLGIWRARARKV